MCERAVPGSGWYPISGAGLGTPGRASVLLERPLLGWEVVRVVSERLTFLVQRDSRTTSGCHG